MKKFLSIILSTVILTSTFSVGCFSEQKETSIVLQVNNPIMTVNGKDAEIDSGKRTTPIIQDNRTLMPIRAIVEAMGGKVQWDSNTRTTILSYNGNEIQLTVDSNIAKLNGNNTELDTVPVIINGRTLLPIRFISESFGFNTSWDSETKSITITKSEETAKDSQPEVIETPSHKSKVLIAYFSRAENIELNNSVDATSSASLNTVNGNIEGNTKLVADMIQAETGGDVFSIQVLEPYPTDYKDNVNKAENEQSDNARPKLKTQIANFDDYDTIFIGYPIWWSTMPMPVYSFLEEYDFTGKTVIPFSTHKGSGMGASQRDTEKAIPNANVLDGFTIEGDNAVNAKNEVKTAIEKLNLNLSDNSFVTEELNTNNNGKNIYGVVYKPANVEGKLPTVIFSNTVLAGELNIDGKSVDTKVEISDGTAKVPVRDVLESLNYSVEWDNDTKSI